MYKTLKPSLVAMAAFAFLTSEASAQYYNPGTVVQNNAFQPGVGLSLGAQNGGLNPNAGFGFGPVGAGAGLGLGRNGICLLYTSPSPRDQRGSRMPSSA